MNISLESSQHGESSVRIAIVGVAGTFPGATKIEQLWQNLLQGHDAITTVPAQRWPQQYFDPQSNSVERFYTNRGGFIDEIAQFDALRFGVMPKAVQGAEPDQLMTLQICAEALEDAGYAPRLNEVGIRGRDFTRERTEVIIGRGGYIGPAMNALNLRVRTTEQLLKIIQEKGWAKETELSALKDSFLKGIRPFGPDTAIGLVPNLCASRVADRLSLGGAAYTIDAACASSLIAVARACEALEQGRADLALAGGVHMVHDLTFWSVFTQLGALSREQQIRPFDSQADGLLIGEGVGAVVLKRLDDAINDGDRVYAVVRGFGLSSDGGQASLMSPDIHGQVRAMKEAWQGLDIKRVGLIEAHGTGTPTGDDIELQSTKQVFGDEGEEIGIGSIKSNIGHTMPAAGIAGLIKAALSIYHGIKPPSLHLSQPHSSFSGRLYPLREIQEWSTTERWAGVSAFGFGGINAHLALSHAPTYSPLRPYLSRLAEPQTVIGIAAPSREALYKQVQELAESSQILEQGSQRIGNGLYRAAFLDPTSDILRKSAQLIQKGKKRQGKQGVWISYPDETKDLTTNKNSSMGHGDLKGKLALMFPGIEASFSPRVDDLCARLGIASPTLYPPNDLGERGVSVVRLGMALNQCFQRFELEVGHLCGHSIGEWTGLIASGYLAEESIEPFIQSLDPQGLDIPEVSFIALGTSAQRVEKVLRDQWGDDLAAQGIYCSHDNCPHQSVFCLPVSQVSDVLTLLKKNQILAQELPFRSGFHAPHFEPYAAQLNQHLRQLILHQPHTPLWSATTLAPYPKENSEEFYELAQQHLLESVRFRALIERLYGEGVRVFVQMGVGSLSSFVSDTLRGRPHRVIDAHSERRSAWAQWLQLAGTLFAEGFDLRLDHLRSSGQRSPQAIQLDLGASLITLNEKSDQRTSSGVKHSKRGEAFTKVPIEGYEKRPKHVGAHLGEATYPSSPLKNRDDSHYHAEWLLRIEDFPYLEDHCFFRQPQNWPILEDRFPVVPMTLSIQWVMEVAQQIADEKGLGQRVIGVREVRAAKWIEIEPPGQVKVNARQLENELVEVELKGHLSAKVILAQKAPIKPKIMWEPFNGEQKPPLHAKEIYRNRWMFHGLAYQGIEDFIGIAPQGIRGVIKNIGIPGALMDNVGQLFGLWVMLTQKVDRVVMPVRLAELNIYGPPPSTGALLPCSVQITGLDKHEVKANMVLWHEGKVWATFKGWSDWRFETSGRLWSLMRYPESNLFAHRLLCAQGVTMTLSDSISAVASSREFLVGRCLNQRERKLYRSLPLAKQRDWLAGRIAAKDALRTTVWAKGYGSLFPIEVGIDYKEHTQLPIYQLDEIPSSLHYQYSLSISHCEGLGLAGLIHPNDQALSLGVDLQQIQIREHSWQTISFTNEELNHLNVHNDSERNEVLTIWWSLKEASAKCASQLGLVNGLGTPKDWWVQSWGRSQKLPLETTDTDIKVLSFGQAVVYSPKLEKDFVTFWWCFEKQEKRWACTLCLSA